MFASQRLYKDIWKQTCHSLLITWERCQTERKEKKENPKVTTADKRKAKTYSFYWETLWQRLLMCGSRIWCATHRTSCHVDSQLQQTSYTQSGSYHNSYCVGIVSKQNICHPQLLRSCIQIIKRSLRLLIGIVLVGIYHQTPGSAQKTHIVSQEQNSLCFNTYNQRVIKIRCDKSPLSLSK